MIEDKLRELLSDYTIYKSHEFSLVDGNKYHNYIFVSPKPDPKQLTLFDYKSNEYWPKKKKVIHKVYKCENSDYLT